jgi:hypothetical protein
LSDIERHSSLWNVSWNFFFHWNLQCILLRVHELRSKFVLRTEGCWSCSERPRPTTLQQPRYNGRTRVS